MGLSDTNILIGPSYPNIRINKPNSISLPIAKLAVMPAQDADKPQSLEILGDGDGASSSLSSLLSG